MSEFKYACPVCGQHMRCDVSQSGTVMECPTCFQKITAPQAPAAGSEQKFVLTGTRAGERPLPKIALEPPVAPPSPRRFSGLILLLILGVCLAGATVWVIRGKRFQASTIILPPLNPVPAAEVPQGESSGKSSAAAAPLIGPSWSLTLGTNAIAETPVAGRIHGQDFSLERAAFQNGSLVLRAGLRGQVEFGAIINFSGATSEALSGRILNVTTNAEKAARVTLRWKDGAGMGQKEFFDGGYALRLEFGMLTNNHLPGKIHLCLPDADESHLVGMFIADARKPKPKSPKK